MEAMMKTKSLLIAGALGASLFAAPLLANDVVHHERIEHRNRANARHIARVRAAREADVEVYRRPFIHRSGWRTYGIHYGLVGPLVGYRELSWLNDGLLVGSYMEDGRPVYVYDFNEGPVTKQVTVTSDGQILDERVFAP
jgi:hypothetical protein